MRFVIIALVLCAAALAGVENDTCWKRPPVRVEVRGTVFGDQEVTVTGEDGTTGTGVGTPDPKGGCADSSEITVGSERYRVKNGRMQHRAANGKWSNMTKVRCDDSVTPIAELA